MQLLRTAHILFNSAECCALRTRMVVGVKVRNFSISQRLPDGGYTKEQQSYLLSIINKSGGSALSPKVVGEGNSKKLKSYLQNGGQFEKLEDLLKIQGLGPRSVRKVCDKLLELGGGVNNNSDNTTELNTPTVRNKTVTNLITPVLSNAHILKLNIATAIKISVNMISWATLDCGRKDVLSWNVIDLPPQDKKQGLHSVLTLAEQVVGMLPSADIYVFEESSNYGGGQASAGHQLYSAQLTAMLVTLLEPRRESEETSVGHRKTVLMKARLMARMFNSIVGSEQVSLQSLVDNIMEQRLSSCHSNVFIGEDVRRAYYCQKGHYKEGLCNALLLAITFMDLIIYKRTSMLNNLSTRSKTKRVASST